METIIVKFDNVQYEVPKPVADKMGEYYAAMTALHNKVNQLSAAIVELADKEEIANKKPLKDNRLSAWYAKKDLFKMVNRFVAYGGGYLKPNS